MKLTVDVNLLKDDCSAALKNGSETVVKKFDQHTTLFHVQVASGGIYFLKSDDFDYLCRYREVELPPTTLPGKSRGIRQVLIHRCRSVNVHASGIAHDIFWNMLLPKHGVLVSDSEQTEDGRRFWFFQIGEALKRGLTVRFIDTNSGTFEEANTPSELNRLMSSSYGPSTWFRRFVIAIF
jgi:hypothetical protein